MVDEKLKANLFIVNRLNSVYWDEFLFEKGENTLLRGLENFPDKQSLLINCFHIMSRTDFLKKVQTY